MLNLSRKVEKALWLSFFFKNNLTMKISIKHLFILLSFTISLLTGCGKNETETLPKLGKEYYPLQIGKAATYDLDSIIYDPISNGVVKIDTFKWQVRELLIDTFRDKSTVLNYTIERSIRPRGTQNWKIESVLTAALTNDHALRTENNVLYIKFPTTFGEKTNWDGNIYVDPSVKMIIAGETLEFFNKKWVYQVESYNISEKIGDKTYQDVMTITAQSDAKILTDKRYTLEKYAKGFGLVYREQKILDTQKLDANIAWEKKAEKGFILTQKAISFN